MSRWLIDDKYVARQLPHLLRRRGRLGEGNGIIEASSENSELYDLPRFQSKMAYVLSETTSLGAAIEVGKLLAFCPRSQDDTCLLLVGRKLVA